MPPRRLRLWPPIALKALRAWITGSLLLRHTPPPRPRPQCGGNTVVYQLNDSPAAVSLYEQLPLDLEVEDFSDNEKIFYPHDELDTSQTPLAEGGAGTLA